MKKLKRNLEILRMHQEDWMNSYKIAKDQWLTRQAIDYIIKKQLWQNKKN